MSKKLALLTALLALALNGGASAQCHVLLLGAGKCGSSSTLLTDLVSDWELNEASGNAVDSHSGGRTLTETSGTIAASTGPGGAGGSRDFEDIDTEYFARASETALQTGDIMFALEAWVNAETLPATDTYVVSKYETAGNLREYRIFWDGGNTKFAFGVSNDGTAQVVVRTTSASPGTGNWAQLIACHDSGNNVIAIYQNDDAGATTAHTTGVLSSTGPFHVGARGSATPTLYFDGLIAKIRFWKGSCPNSTQRTWLYNSGSGRSYADLSSAP